MDKIVSARTIRRRAVAQAEQYMLPNQDVLQGALTPSQSHQPDFVLHESPDVLQGALTPSQSHQPDFVFQVSQSRITEAQPIPDEANELSYFNDDSFNDALLDAVEDTDNESDEENLELLIRDNLQQWVLDSGTPLCHANTLLGILRPYFSNLPKDGRTLLQTGRTVNVEIVAGGKYYHFGVFEGVTSRLKENQNLQSCNNLTLQINVDGLPLFKSTSDCFWPILALIEEEKPFIPFIIGLWIGKSKPTNANDFLHKFVAEMKNVELHGITYSDKNYIVKIAKCICDAPARSFIKLTKGHTGYYGCDFCTQSGVYIEHRMTFPEVSAPTRTDAAFRRMEYDEHIKDESILLQLNIGLVSQFPHDYMHNVCLGVMKKIIGLLLHGPLGVRVSNNVSKIMSDAIVNCSQFLPREFLRKGRSLIEVDRWKATEFRTFLLYTGQVVLRGNVSEACYNNFLMLSVGIRMLCDSNFVRTHCDYAEDLLKVFVTHFGQLYGAHSLVYNVHGITHLAAQCRLYGSLTNFSCFPFENFLQSIKKLVRKPNQPLQQVVHRLHERRNKVLPSNVQEDCKYKKPHNNGPVPDDIPIGCQQYEQIHCAKYQLSITSPDNAILINGTTYVIRNIVTFNNLTRLICKRFRSQESFFDYPLDSQAINIAFVRNLRATSCTLDPSNISSKVILLPFRGGHVSVPMLE